MVENEKNFKHIVRILMTDISGNATLNGGLQKVKGVNHALSHAICTVLKLKDTEKIGNIDDKTLKTIEDIIKDPISAGMPSWMLNRRKDLDDGTDKHLANIDLKLQKEFDYKRLQKIKSYRGLRLSVGLPVRGQRTRSNFRNKKGGKSLGVKKKKR
jgi:small subunit ribosomal protein S13